MEPEISLSWEILPSGIWIPVNSWKSTDVSEEHVTSVFKQCLLIASCWFLAWRLTVNRQHTTHISQKTELFNNQSCKNVESFTAMFIRWQLAATHSEINPVCTLKLDICLSKIIFNIILLCRPSTSKLSLRGKWSFLRKKSKMANNIWNDLGEWVLRNGGRKKLISTVTCRLVARQRPRNNVAMQRPARDNGSSVGCGVFYEVRSEAISGDRPSLRTNTARVQLGKKSLVVDFKGLDTKKN
jgi:hypothetical protein